MKILIVILLLATTVINAGALIVNLRWDANSETDLAGYKVYYGAGNLVTPAIIDVGLVTTASVTGLNDLLTYYFAVTAYNISGLESGYSNVVIVYGVKDQATHTASGRFSIK
jgi:hypothetical protein